MDALKKLVRILKKNKLTIAFAESVTCGLASYKMNTLPGTSEIFMGSVICYNKAVKTRLLKIDETLLQKFTAESQEVTDAMAKNLSGLIKADVYAAVTGLSAPGGSETKKKPVGTVFITVIFRSKELRKRKRFYGTPARVKLKACELMFEMAGKIILKQI